MENLPSYYFGLFNAVTDALTALNQQNYGLAKELLIHAQQQAEEDYLSAGED